MKYVLLALSVVACNLDHEHELDEHDHHIVAGVVSHRAETSGRWDAASTWNTGTVPPDGAGVVIPNGIMVTLRSETARVKFVDVRGTLRFASDATTRLTVETLQVFPAGKLQIGSDAAPVEAGHTAEIVFIDNGIVLPTQADPQALRRGLIATGEVTIFGAAKTPYATLSGPLASGTQTLTLDDNPAGWRANDVVVVPATRFRKDSSRPQNERRTLATRTGNVVELAAPLDHLHRLDASMKLHVANLTRNVTVRSENDAVDEPRRGHVMIMNCGAARIENAAFVDLGRTDKSRLADNPQLDDNGKPVAGTGRNPAGRYPLHFHQCGLAGEAQVRGSVVVGSPGWGMVNHGSRVSFTANVVSDFVGAGFVAEDGNELGAFVRNFALGGTGTGEFRLRRVYLDTKERMREGDFAFHGDCFWFQSPLVAVRENIAAGCKGVGFFVLGQGLNRAGGVGFLPSQLPPLDPPLGQVRRWGTESGYRGLLIPDLPILQFSDNTAYGNFIGIKIRYVQNRNTLGFRIWGTQVKGDDTYLTSRIDAPPEVQYQPYSIVRSKLWNNFVGIHNSYTSLGVFRDTFIGTNDAVPTTDVEEMWVGWEADHNSAAGLTVQDMTVKGYPVGIMIHPDPTDPHTINGYSYVGSGTSIMKVAAGGSVRQ